MAKFNFEIDESGRIDKILPPLLNISRSKFEDIIKKGVLVNSKEVTKASFKLSIGDKVEVDYLEEVKENFVPKDIPLNILYEDEYLLVINKQRGIVVHPSVGHANDSVVNALVYNSLVEEDEDQTKYDVYRPGIVHRIDKDTSGLLIVAKTNKVKELLCAMIKEHAVKREYFCLCDGVVKYTKFTIRVPLTKADKITHKVKVDLKEGRDAISHFKLIKAKSNRSLLYCELETGRTHQIRAHLSYYDYPIVNDPLYNKNVKESPNGQVLHAFRVTFIHPVTNKEIRVVAPIDEYFKKMLIETFK